MTRTDCILVVCETGPSGRICSQSIEIIGCGLEIARQMNFKLVLAVPGAGASESTRFPANRIYTAMPPPDTVYCPDWHVAFIEQACLACEPFLVIFPHTPLGQDIGSRIAARFDAGIVTDCGRVTFEGENIFALKQIQGGVAVATYSFKTRMKIITLRKGSASPCAITAPGTPEIVELEIPLSAFENWKVIERGFDDCEKGNLDDADIIVSGGRGLGGAEGFARIGELSERLNAAVASSRPPCDLGWISPSLQVGITGKCVKPRVYIAIGISGASQHISGMADSKIIVAINRDDRAPIFKVADYGVVGDYRDILPGMMEVLAASKRQKDQ